MEKFHINPQSGRVNICRATQKCPWGGDENHFTSREAARSAYEKRFESQMQESMSKADPIDRVIKRGKYYAAATTKDLSLKDKLRLLARDNGGRNAEAPEAPQLRSNPNLNQLTPGSLLYEEKSGRVIRFYSAGRNPYGENLLTGKLVDLNENYKLIENAYLGVPASHGERELMFSSDEIALAKHRDKKLTEERAEQLKKWQEEYAADKKAREEEQARKDIWNENPRPLQPLALKETQFSTQGRFGSGVFEHYDLDTFNSEIDRIKSSELSEDDKIQAVYQQRERLLAVLTDNVNNTPADVDRDASVRERVSGFFKRLREPQEATSEEKTAVIDFAKRLLSAPYYSKVEFSLRNYY